MSEIKFTYNLEKDINSGAIEVYTPNLVNDRIMNFESLKGTASLHGMTPLKGAKAMMKMYDMNYGNKEHYPQAQERIDKWKNYIKNRIT